MNKTKYKSYECPKCGCCEFERYKSSKLIHNFRDGKFIIQNDLTTELGFMHCVKCKVKINLPASIEQNKVVLMT